MAEGEGIHLYSDFGEFTVAITTYLTGNFKAKHLIANGHYDDESQALGAAKVTLFLAKPRS